MYSGWNFLIWKSSWILTCSFITAVLILCKEHIWVLLYFKYSLHCMELRTTLLPYSFSPMMPGYTSDLKFTEGICNDLIDFEYESKSCRRVMLMQADLSRRWYMANMFSSRFLSFLPSRRHLLLQRGTAVASKSGTFTLCAYNYFFFLPCKPLLKSHSEYQCIRNKHKNHISG